MPANQNWFGLKIVGISASRIASGEVSVRESWGTEESNWTNFRKTYYHFEKNWKADPLLSNNHSIHRVTCRSKKLWL